MLTGAVWSAAVPNERIWPPPAKKTWQFYISWLFFLLTIALNILLIVLDWNSGTMLLFSRFSLGIPVIVIGCLLSFWGMASLGLKNTSGLQTRLIDTRPYRYMRNPQYIGYILILIGISLVANSRLAWIVNLLQAMVFIIVPMAEKSWLEERYGEDYRKYKLRTQRFL